MRGRPRKFFTRPQDSADPRYADDLILQANFRFDRIYPKDDQNYYTLPMPDYMDLAPPGFCKEGLRANDLDPVVWEWLTRGISDGERVPILHAHFRTAEP